jgi:hypothetical protein
VKQSQEEEEEEEEEEARRLELQQNLRPCKNG